MLTSTNTKILEQIDYCLLTNDKPLLEKILNESPNEPLQSSDPTQPYFLFHSVYKAENWDMFEMLYARSDKSEPYKLLNFTFHSRTTLAWKLAFHKKIHLLKKIIDDAVPEESQAVNIICQENISLAWLLAAQEEWLLLEKINFYSLTEHDFYDIVTSEGWPQI